MKSTRWKKAQKDEQRFWDWLNKSYGESTFVADVQDYFSKILNLTGLKFSETAHYLDVGCGPTPIFLALDKGKRIALDPLMDYYQNTYSHLRRLKDVTWLTGKFEDWENKQIFNTVFMLNCLNHCEDLKTIVGKFNSFVAPGGNLVLTQHCHTQAWTQRFFAKTNSFIDTCHPHHFQKKDVISLLRKGFELEKELNIDSLDVERVLKTNRSLKKRCARQRIAGLFKQPDRLTRYISLLVSYFYKKELAGRPAISNYLFVFRKTSI
jgi:SAM-dependent methyltransferase